MPTVFERAPRFRFAVTTSLVGRVFRAFSAANRMLDVENVATTGVNRINDVRLAQRRRHYDVGGSISVFGDDDFNPARPANWDFMLAATKTAIVSDGALVVAHNTSQDFDAGLAPRLEGATIDFPDGPSMLATLSLRVRRYIGSLGGAPTTLFTFALNSASPVSTRDVSFAEDAPALAIYVIDIQTATFLADTAFTVVNYPCIAIGTTLHFSVRSSS